jgi:hypothetical protein
VMDSEFTCAICLEISENAVEANCCHNIYCEECLKPQKLCPTCRFSPMTFSPSHVARRIIGKKNNQNII